MALSTVRYPKICSFGLQKPAKHFIIASCPFEWKGTLTMTEGTDSEYEWPSAALDRGRAM
jgi:hypothetical protein